MEAAELTVSKKNESLTDTIKEIIGGFSVVKSFKAEKAVLQFFLKNNPPKTVGCIKSIIFVVSVIAFIVLFLMNSTANLKKT